MRDLMQEVPDDRSSLGRVNDLGVKLYTRDAVVRTLDTHNGRVLSARGHHESRGRLYDFVSMTHPNLRAVRDPMEQLRVRPNVDQIGPAVLTLPAQFDVPPEDMGDGLKSVANPSNRHPKFENPRVKLG